MSDELILSELVGKNGTFDPMSVDTSQIRTLSSAMPMDGNIDVNNAEVLATKYLRGADMCGEMLAIATAHVAKMKDAKQRAYNYAFVVKSAEVSTIKTDKMRTAFSELDDDYQDACHSFNEAYAFVKWIDSKYGSFNKMHYMCRKILDRGYDHERMSNFNQKIDEESDADFWSE